MSDDYLLDAARKHWDQIHRLYETFEALKPIILLDIQEQRLYFYPYNEFKEGLKTDDQNSFHDLYERATATNQIVVFVRDNVERRLVSFSFDYEGGDAARSRARRKRAKTGVNRSEFIRNALTKKPDLDHRQVNLLWAKADHVGEISKVLFYQVRRKMGIKSEYRWILGDDRG
jgi:hypothetical protein